MELPTQGMLPPAISVGMHDPSPVINRELKTSHVPAYIRLVFIQDVFNLP